MATIYCTKHPDYAVKGKPTGVCATCTRMWMRRHARRICANPTCKRVFVWHGDSGTKFCSSRCGYAVIRSPALPASEQVAADRQKRTSKTDLDALRKKYDEALKLISQQEKDLRSMGALGDGIETFTIEPRKSSRTSEAVPVIVASDWHTEERVTRAQTSGLNEFNAAICQARVERFFRASLNLIKNHLNPGVEIHTVVLALLGDFITNHLHEEAAETNGALPMQAIVAVQNQIASGIQYYLDNSPYSFIIPCKSGNHARTTLKTRFATENGHSLEYLMYVHLAAYFRQEKRIQFQINEGYHDYLNIYDKVVRLHHGHAINYGGGIGGIFIPAFKAISQWSKARRADLDIFGHFHQAKDGGNFVSNGSLIGYNSYALSIKADYESPQQTLILIDKKRGRTCTWPVLLS